MNEFLLIAGMAVVTFGIRYSMFAVAGKVEFPARLVNALKYVPPAVLTAIVIPAVLMPDSESINLSYTNAYLVGALVAGVIGWTSKNLLLTIVVGMTVFLGWQWFVG